MRSALFLFCISFADPQLAEPPKWAVMPDGLTKEEIAALELYAATAEPERPAAIRYSESRVSQLKKRIPPRGEERTQRLQEIKAAQDRAELLKAGVAIPWIPSFRGRAKKGQIGHINANLEVNQIVDGVVIVKIEGADEDIAIQGMDTDNLADGAGFRIRFSMVCVGVSSFKTVLGATRSLTTFAPFPYEVKVAEWENNRIARWRNEQAELKAKKKTG